MTTGLYVVGALGEVGTTLASGLCALSSGQTSTTGLVTAAGPLASAGLVGLDELVLGGVDVREGDWVSEAGAIVGRGGAIPWQVFRGIEERLVDLGAPDRVEASTPGPLSRRLELFRSLLKSFQDRQGLDRVVVIDLATTQAPAPREPWTEDPSALERRLNTREPVTDSLLWCLAAADQGCAHVGFTPSPGFDLPALKPWGEKIPHAGKDGKTGETLVKSVLAPMFLGRNLKVLGWEGLNLLGNADGEALRDTARAAGKLANKDAVLHRILGDGVPGRTRIDYSPSLGDWKTAWDHIHFEGFLGVRMQMQFCWQGCDSALAAPLCLDLARLMDRALERGDKGPQSHLAVFFKNPLGTDQVAFSEQMDMLIAQVGNASK
ncbi:MAG: inositol-3-phosphate synthase [Planctomycetota bacterium]